MKKTKGGRIPNNDGLISIKRTSQLKSISPNKIRKLGIVIGHPFFSSFLAAILAAGITAFVQYKVTNLEISFLRAQADNAEQRRRLATAILLSNDLSEIEGQILGFSAITGAVSVNRLLAWKISVGPLLRRDVEDLALFDSMFLGRYGALVASLETMNASIDVLKEKYNGSFETVVSPEEMVEIRQPLSHAYIASSYLTDELARLYRASRLPIGSTAGRRPAIVSPQ